ncbi:MAG: ABC transporter ATP-binding protein [Alphaproteobacteria bacterium HGW-Alphaproteobacteria-2]|nr:MAG: ABC transporter ATP-binding protein [Alphaproteobacteria bacterium HGW-Alphaproteobacteria-2]
MIEARGIHVTFNPGTPLETQALRGVDLDLGTGQFLTVIGSNGAGKSTFLNVLAGTCPVTRGSVRIDGQEVTRWPVHRRARLISRVFQDPRLGTCDALTVIENFALAWGRTRPRGLRHATTRAMREAAAEKLRPLGLGLEDRLDDKVGLLSGGQRQAVSLLMATTGETRVLLLDEHTAALDPRTGAFVLDLTRQVVAELGLTAVMVTHSMAQAIETGDRLIMFHRGQIIFDVAGVEHRALSVPDLLALFRRTQGEELADDALLLS